MSKSKFLSLLLIGAAALPTGCNIQNPPAQNNQQPSDQVYYYGDYEDWRGPGWYYGIYFYNQWGYNNWRRHHGRHGHRGGHGHGGRHHGGHGGGHRH